MSHPTLRRPPDAAKYLKDRFGFGTACTLAKLRCLGGGPEFRKIGSKLIVYEEEALDAWGNSKLSTSFRSTSEAAAA
jgi:hypothetical protein